MSIRILTYSTLFPNAAVPHHGIFVRNRLNHLRATGQVEAAVVAPVEWFPFKHAMFGEYAKFAKAPSFERQDELAVYHPRFPVIPKVGMNLAPSLLASFSKSSIKRLLRQGFDFDLIDAHYFYPDGVAAAKLKKWLNKPLVITARGTDINLIPKYKKPRQKILQAAQTADAIITVCAALKDAIVELGVDAEKVTVLRNGVDLHKFQLPHDRDALRTQLNLDKPTLLSVGHLIERKGHHLVIEAMQQLPDYQLLVAGSGVEEKSLRDLVGQYGLLDRVTFLGALPQDELIQYYSAVDALILASSREGWANVLLESMACGTPVVATPVWGTPEVVANPVAGVLTEDRSAQAIARAVQRLFAAYPDRNKTREYAEQFNWDATSQGQLEIFQRVIQQHKSPSAAPASVGI